MKNFLNIIRKCNIGNDIKKQLQSLVSKHSKDTRYQINIAHHKWCENKINRKQSAEGDKSISLVTTLWIEYNFLLIKIQYFCDVKRKNSRYIHIRIKGLKFLFSGTENLLLSIGVVFLELLSKHVKAFILSLYIIF